MLASRMSGLRPNLASRNAIVPSLGRLYSHERSPRANMFFARSASFFVTSKPLSASTVIEVRAIGCRL